MREKIFAPALYIVKKEVFLADDVRRAVPVPVAERGARRGGHLGLGGRGAGAHRRPTLHQPQGGRRRHPQRGVGA